MQRVEVLNAEFELKIINGGLRTSAELQKLVP